jgi:hypothetical protein
MVDYRVSDRFLTSGSEQRNVGTLCLGNINQTFSFVKLKMGRSEMQQYTVVIQKVVTFQFIKNVIVLCSGNQRLDPILGTAHCLSLGA